MVVTTGMAGEEGGGGTDCARAENAPIAETKAMQNSIRENECLVFTVALLQSCPWLGMHAAGIR